MWQAIYLGWMLWLETTGVRPVEGLRERDPDVHALVGGRIVQRAGVELERGTLVLRDGVIEAIGPDVAVPTDARVWDMQGKVIYPGFIDAYGEMSVPVQEVDRGATHWHPWIQPQRRAVEAWSPTVVDGAAYRQQGILVRCLAPAEGIMKGRSVVVTLADGPTETTILRADFSQHMRLAIPSSGGSDQYPSSPMGAVALARQTLYDAQWYRDARRVHASLPTSLEAPPAENDALEALQACWEANLPVVFDTMDEQYLLRADRFAREFSLRAVLRGSGHEYRRLEAVSATGWPLIVPLNFPLAPNVATVEGAADVSLESLMHWDLAPENPARLHQAGVPLMLTTHGLPSPADFLKQLRRAIDRGLPADAALRALTETPAAWMGLERQVGQLEKGYLAHLIVADGDLFRRGSESRVVETWIGARHFTHQASERTDPRGRWTIDSHDGTQRPDFEVTGRPGEWKVTFLVPNANGETRTDWSHPQYHEPLLTGDFPASGLQVPNAAASNEGTNSAASGDAGIARISLTLVGATTDARRWEGWCELPAGQTLRIVARRAAQPTPTAQPDATQTPAQTTATADGATAAATSSATPSAPTPPPTIVNYPLGDAGRSAPPTAHEHVIFRGGTVWTCGPAGTLTDVDVIVQRGLIEYIGPRRETLAPGTVIVDVTGQHLTPGIIDCHSHIATDGGVNEGTQAITAEVRIGDFIDARDLAIYRQLAGGVTCANILHGSANPIGGQNQVIKFRWGLLPEEMKFAEAPAGIKFALGENVKQSNWGDQYTRRYPKSRMGVEQIVRDAMLAARQYRDAQRRWNERREGLPPRRDLELDALVEVLDGQRWIHCHSYRQDEILALLRTMESINVRVGTLQHILEGYKVADAIQRHGAAASSFADWWAYKFEVYDAIPFNGAILHRQGVNVSFNSDDEELARHLNHEAAKAVKYGGVSPEDALRFVTLNPAQQLRIDRWVGSLEVGKQADLVVWNGPPLSAFTRCQQTWIEGRKYFDLDEDRQMRDRDQTLRHVLVQKILRQDAPQASPEALPPREERDRWPRVDIYCTRHSRVR